MPSPLLLRRNARRVKQDLLRRNSASPSTPIGPNALSERSSSVSWAPAFMIPLPRCCWNY